MGLAPSVFRFRNGAFWLMYFEELLSQQQSVAATTQLQYALKRFLPDDGEPHPIEPLDHLADIRTSSPYFGRPPSRRKEASRCRTDPLADHRTLLHAAQSVS